MLRYMLENGLDTVKNYVNVRITSYSLTEKYKKMKLKKPWLYCTKTGIIDIYIVNGHIIVIGEEDSTYEFNLFG